MSPLVKKVAAALALKEVVDRVQEARRPKRSFAARNKGKALLAAVAGGGAYLYRTGKLDTVVRQAKALTGRTGPTEPAAYPAGPAPESRSPVGAKQAERPLEPTNA